MIDYEKVSDYQLSESILKTKGYSIMTRTMQLPHSACMGRDDNGIVFIFNINNPSGMRPLIEEIWKELIKDAKTKNEAYEYRCTMWHKIMNEHNCGKLRAAAIVYLKLMESE